MIYKLYDLFIGVLILHEVDTCTYELNIIFCVCDIRINSIK